MMAVMALALFTGANAQTTTIPATDNNPPQEATQPVRSHYDTCLLTANNSTWEALGLNNDQVTRIAEVQTRYKAYVAPPKEEAKAKQKGKKSKAVKSRETAAKDEMLDKSAGHDATDAKQTDETLQKPSEATPDNTRVDETAAAMSAQPVPFDEELRGILTPEQWAMWDKRCADTSMK